MTFIIIYAICITIEKILGVHGSDTGGSGAASARGFAAHRDRGPGAEDVLFVSLKINELQLKV